MDLSLSDHVAIVTGASRGIGRAIATTLHQEAMKLVVVARTRSLLEELGRLLGSRCLVHAADLREAGAAEEMVQVAMNHYGRLDLLVNNAGATTRGDFLKLSDDAWTDGFALKFFGTMRAIRAAWPHLRETRGSVVNIVGIGGRTASAEFTIGGSVNAALLNLTKALADRGVQDGVRVNAINPGAVATDRLWTRIERYAEENGLDQSAAAAEMARSLKIERFGRPEEIAEIVAFLASPRAAYVQGAILDADGGQTRTL